jgi:DNA-binding NarL/FixJ family response regulator
LLELLSHGLSDEQIGAELQLPVAMVRANIREAVDAMGARNRAHAVALALKTGLFD